MVLSNLQGPLLCKTSLQVDKYYEEQFMKKDQSLRIPEKANMQEYIERLETIVKRWGDEEIVLQGVQPTPLKYGFIKPTGAASM